MIQLLLDFLSHFRLIANYRARREAERLHELERLASERKHQLGLLNGILATLGTIQEQSFKESSTNAKALVEVSKGLVAQATSFSDYLKLFQGGVAPTSTVVTDEDEYEAEQQRLMEEALPEDMRGMDEAFKLAWIQKNDPHL